MVRVRNMLATFCLRLACGLVAALTLLSPAQVNPRFYRTHFLITLGLTVVAAVFLREETVPCLWAPLGCAIVLAFVGSLLWSLQGSPCGRTLVAATAVALIASLAILKLPDTVGPSGGMIWATEASSAALLGSSTTAMLMGHSYLIAPAMSLTPLKRLLGTLFASLFFRSIVAGIGLWSWTTERSLANLNEVTVLLPLRWGIGIIGPFVLGTMAWHTAKIRSTQSATGILYVVVIFCFLGELTGQVLDLMTLSGR